MVDHLNNATLRRSDSLAEIAKYAPEDPRLRDAEKEAREAKRGLWAAVITATEPDS